MSRSIDGNLILGWEVDICDVTSMYDEDGEYLEEVDENVQEKADTILEGIGIEAGYDNGPTWVWSLYHDNDYMWIGVPLSTKCESIDQFVKRVSENAEVYERAAMEIYEVLMGKPPLRNPSVMRIGYEE